jgi:hypothetical protein
LSPEINKSGISFLSFLDKAVKHGPGAAFRGSSLAGIHIPVFAIALQHAFLPCCYILLLLLISFIALYKQYLLIIF